MKGSGFAVAAGREYTAATQQSLRNVDESLINYELLDSLVCHIAARQDADSSGANAVLIFLPGAAEISRLVRALQVRLRAVDKRAFLNPGLLPLILSQPCRWGLGHYYNPDGCGLEYGYDAFLVSPSRIKAGLLRGS